MITGIVDLKLNNIFSIENACKKLGLKTVKISSKDQIKSCDALILPGVGSFHKAIYRLDKLNLSYEIKDFINSGKPFLGICLGMQLLFEKSYEFVKSNGLSIFKGDVVSLDAIDRSTLVPHIGMNYLELETKTKNSNIKIYEGKKYFFNHSFTVQADDNLCLSKTKLKNEKFISVINKEKILGTQFHPELSYDHGLELIKCLKNL